MSDWCPNYCGESPCICARLWISTDDLERVQVVADPLRHFGECTREEGRDAGQLLVDADNELARCENVMRKQRAEIERLRQQLAGAAA